MKFNTVIGKLIGRIGANYGLVLGGRKKRGLFGVIDNLPIVGRSSIENNGDGSVILPNDDVLNDVWYWGDYTNQEHYTVDGMGLTEQVNDISGKGFHATQSTDVNRPSYQASLINGLGGLVFEGGDSLKIGTISDFKFLGNGSPHIIFKILKRTDTSGEQYIYLWNCLGGLTNGMFFENSNEEVAWLTRNLNGSGTLDNNIGSATSPFTYNTFHKTALVFRGLDVAGTDKEIFVDNFTTSVASADGLTATIDNGDNADILTIGGYNNTNFQLCELGIMNPSLANISSYMTILENYALSKYNI